MVNRDNTVNIQGRIMVIVPFLPLTDIYLLTKFHFNPFCTFQDMARTGNNYEKWLSGDNSVNTQGRIMVLCAMPFLILPSICKPSSIASLLYFPRYGPDRQQL